MFSRIILFLATNFAVLILAGIIMSVLGVDPSQMSGLLVMAAIFGFGGSFISLLLSKFMAKRATGAQVITEPRSETERWLVETVRRQAQAVGIGMPEVAIYDAPEINAFATGMSRNSSLIAVSTGLLDQMTRAEAEAVLAHEVAHAANGDMVTLALIQGVVNTFVMFLSRVIGYLIDKVIFKTERGQGPAFFITMIIAELVLGVLASIIVMHFSRKREFRADQGGASLAGRQNMIAALERLNQAHAPAALPEKMAAFGISGGGGSGLKRLFMTHPPIQERIERLRQMNATG